MAYSEESAARFDAPVYLGSMFGVSSSSDDDDGDAASGSRRGKANGMASRGEDRLDAGVAGRSVDAAGMRFEQSVQHFPQMTMRIRQFDDHFRNANILWPEARCLAQWLIGEHEFTEEEGRSGSEAASAPSSADGAAPSPSANELRRARFDNMLIGFPSGLTFPTESVPAGPSAPLAVAPLCSQCGRHRRPKRVLELGAATGALCIFLSALGVDMHSSDIDDAAVTSNIAHNYALNGMRVPHHLSHSWGVDLPRVDAYVAEHGAPDVILGSDILAYEDDFEALADTICHLMPEERNGAAAASSDASSSSSSLCSACTPEPVLYMCWKRSHDKSLLDGGFWQLLHSRGFRIATSGHKTYDIRRRTAAHAANDPPLREGQFVHYLHAAAVARNKQADAAAERDAQRKARPARSKPQKGNSSDQAAKAQ